ncbi:MAG: AsnC family protein, partial [Halobacteriota archaeon]|nr:AsnC family protein [Halobacteriota archaeon]
MSNILKSMGTEIEIDDIDRKIIEMLQKDSRVSFVEIAKVVGLS